ncbi:metal-dependent hydrolase [Desulfurobacterium indicum]|uniref:Metal-dependent hydrolase n=1 Tax=Desulfurobacterium indicum TaxID=1914305 RepID=A0A1R1ML84_9BACT|nr:metal-dependent hydrolase [Desulfurobacterium indicum]OMH40568.1 metal-dependent hydrolase [Desulfurobacterium indicum]
MTTGTHILAGVAVALYFKLPIFPAVFGSVFPDVDLKKGFPKKRTLFNSHRGITHHVAIPVILTFMLFFFKDVIPSVIFRDVLSFSLGYASHLLLDSLTPLGVPVGFSYRQRFSFKLLKSGKLSEIIVALLLLIFLAGIFKKESITLESFFGRDNISFLMNMLK